MLPERRQTGHDGMRHPKQSAERKTGWRRVAGLLGRAVYLVPVGLFVAGYAAAYLPPRWFWWTGLLATLVPYTSLLLVVLTPLALWRYHWRGRLLHLAVLVLAAVRFVPLTAAFGGAEAGEGDLVLMTFNAPVRGP